MSVAIPDKSYFKIGEVSRILGVEPYNIRYWESQFRAIKPAKTKSKQRLYRRRDIEILLRIKKLLYEEGYTISGAKKRLKSLLEGADQAEADDAIDVADELGLTQEERRAYDDLLQRSQSELLQLRAEVATLSAELARQRHEHSAQLEALSADHAAVVARLRAADVEIAQLVAQRQSDAVSSSSERNRLDEERAEHRQRLALLEDEARQLRAELAAAHQDRADIADLKARLNSHLERAVNLNREVERLQRRIRYLRDSLRAELAPLLEVGRVEATRPLGN